LVALPEILKDVAVFLAKQMLNATDQEIERGARQGPSLESQKSLQQEGLAISAGPTGGKSLQ